jgi:hypothetical protein
MLVHPVEKQPMSKDIRQRLRALYATDVMQVEELLGRRLPWSNFSER